MLTFCFFTTITTPQHARSSKHPRTEHPRTEATTHPPSIEVSLSVAIHKILQEQIPNHQRVADCTSAWEGPARLRPVLGTARTARAARTDQMMPATQESRGLGHLDGGNGPGPEPHHPTPRRSSHNIPQNNQLENITSSQDTNPRVSKESTIDPDLVLSQTNLQATATAAPARSRWLARIPLVEGLLAIVRSTKARFSSVGAAEHLPQWHTRAKSEHANSPHPPEPEAAYHIPGSWPAGQEAAMGSALSTLCGTLPRKKSAVTQSPPPAVKTRSTGRSADQQSNSTVAQTQQASSDGLGALQGESDRIAKYPPRSTSKYPPRSSSKYPPRSSSIVAAAAGFRIGHGQAPDPSVQKTSTTFIALQLASQAFKGAHGRAAKETYLACRAAMRRLPQLATSQNKQKADTGIKALSVTRQHRGEPCCPSPTSIMVAISQELNEKAREQHLLSIIFSLAAFQRQTSGGVQRKLASSPQQPKATRPLLSHHTSGAHILSLNGAHALPHSSSKDLMRRAKTGISKKKLKELFHLYLVTRDEYIASLAFVKPDHRNFKQLRTNVETIIGNGTPGNIVPPQEEHNVQAEANSTEISQTSPVQGFDLGECSGNVPRNILEGSSSSVVESVTIYSKKKDFTQLVAKALREQNSPMREEFMFQPPDVTKATKLPEVKGAILKSKENPRNITLPNGILKQGPLRQVAPASGSYNEFILTPNAEELLESTGTKLSAWRGVLETIQADKAPISPQEPSKQLSAADALQGEVKSTQQELLLDEETWETQEEENGEKKKKKKKKKKKARMEIPEIVAFHKLVEDTVTLGKECVEMALQEALELPISTRPASGGLLFPTPLAGNDIQAAQQALVPHISDESMPKASNQSMLAEGPAPPKPPTLSVPGGHRDQSTPQGSGSTSSKTMISTTKSRDGKGGKKPRMTKATLMARLANEMSDYELQTQYLPSITSIDRDCASNLTKFRPQDLVALKAQVTADIKAHAAERIQSAMNDCGKEKFMTQAVKDEVRRFVNTSATERVKEATDIVDQILTKYLVNPNSKSGATKNVGKSKTVHPKASTISAAPKREETTLHEEPERVSEPGHNFGIARATTIVPTTIVPTKARTIVIHQAATAKSASQAKLQGVKGSTLSEKQQNHIVKSEMKQPWPFQKVQIPGKKDLDPKFAKFTTQNWDAGRLGEYCFKYDRLSHAYGKMSREKWMDSYRKDNNVTLSPPFFEETVDDEWAYRRIYSDEYISQYLKGINKLPFIAVELGKRKREATSNKCGFYDYCTAWILKVDAVVRMDSRKDISGQPALRRDMDVQTCPELGISEDEDESLFGTDGINSSSPTLSEISGVAPTRFSKKFLEDAELIARAILAYPGASAETILKSLPPLANKNVKGRQENVPKAVKPSDRTTMTNSVLAEITGKSSNNKPARPLASIKQANGVNESQERVPPNKAKSASAIQLPNVPSTLTAIPAKSETSNTKQGQQEKFTGESQGGKKDEVTTTPPGNSGPSDTNSPQKSAATPQGEEKEKKKKKKAKKKGRRH
ncbi:hypothetical protein DFH27DRAFT_612550 [Peziza echinospora]|nr:hypothetical protein DFH27DRAFT_612550 [Peziza echinospora]